MLVPVTLLVGWRCRLTQHVSLLVLPTVAIGNVGLDAKP